MKIELAAADADVLESHGPQTNRVEQVLGVYNERTLQQVFDAIEVEPAELRPARAHHQGVHALGGSVWRFAIVDGAIQFQAGLRDSYRIISANASPFGNHALCQPHGRGPRYGSWVGVEPQAQDARILVGYRLHRVGNHI